MIAVIETTRVPVEQLKPYPGNARRGDLPMIVESLREHGQYRALVVNKPTMEVLAGNHTLQGIEQLEWPDALVDYVDVTPEQARKINLIDNRANDHAGYDNAALLALIEAAKAADGGLSGSGYSEEDAAALRAALHDAETGTRPPPFDGPKLTDRFLVAPFSVLDARSGWWQDRKRQWLALGMQPKFGSGDGGEEVYRATAGTVGARMAAVNKRRGPKGPRMTWAAGKRPLEQLDDTSARNAGASSSGTSMWDPVLLEIMLRWFCPRGGRVVDPFAGGTCHGAVASTLGYEFVGVEVRADQVDTNNALAKEKGWGSATWVCGDSATIHKGMPGGTFDLVLTDPPYFNLEVYSGAAEDGSTKKTYQDFLQWYVGVLKRAASVLKDDRFFVVKIGEARDARGYYPNLVGDTSRLLIEAGLHYLNEMILVTAVGSLPVRTARPFVASRRVGKTHQNVLVFLKGDLKRAVAACGEVEIPSDGEIFGEDTTAEELDQA